MDIIREKSRNGAETGEQRFIDWTRNYDDIMDYTAAIGNYHDCT